MNTCILALLTLLHFLPAFALAEGRSEPVIILGNDETQSFGTDVLVFRDETAKLSANEVLASPYRERFLVLGSGAHNPGYTHDVYWVLVTLDNRSTIDDWYLIPDNPLLAVQAFEIHEDGSILPAPRERLESRIVFKMSKLVRGKSASYLLRVSSKVGVNLQFKILSYEQLALRSTQETIFIGIIAGVFLAMIIYNLFLYTTLRDRDYLFYLLFAIVNGHLNLLSVKYPPGIYEWFGIDWWSLLGVYRPLAPLTTFFFARSFLQTKVENPRLDKIFILYMIGIGLFIPCSFFVSTTLLYALEDTYFLFGVLLLIFAGFTSLKRGFGPSNFYLFGLGFFTVGMGIYLAQTEGLLPTNALTLNSHIAFQAVEMLLMSLALGGKIKQLQEGKARAEVTASVKSRLLRVISHDIANPLSIVKATAHILRFEKLHTPRIEGILRAVGIIEEIMRFVHKTESLDGGKKLKAETVDLKEVFEGLAFVFQNMAKDKGVRLNFELENPDIQVKAEKTSLTYEVLGNFMSNAIKFSFSGSEVSIRACYTSQGKVQITVMDRGIGMNAKTLAGIFDPLLNFSRPGTSGEKGGGYGMPLAKAFIDGYGDGIEVESISIDEDPKACGTTIRIVLPSAGVSSMSALKKTGRKWRFPSA